MASEFTKKTTRKLSINLWRPPRYGIWQWHASTISFRPNSTLAITYPLVWRSETLLNVNDLCNIHNISRIHLLRNYNNKNVIGLNRINFKELFLTNIEMDLMVCHLLFSKKLY